MDVQIEKLKTTTFFGRRFNRKQIAKMKETVIRFPALSRDELAMTLCENLNWTTPKGNIDAPPACALWRHWNSKLS